MGAVTDPRAPPARAPALAPAPVPAPPPPPAPPPAVAGSAPAGGGLPSLSAHPDRPPVTPGTPTVPDYLAGVFAAVGALIAAPHAGRPGHGEGGGGGPPEAGA